VLPSGGAYRVTGLAASAPRHPSRARWVRGQIGARRRTGCFHAIAREWKGLPQPECCSDTFCRELVATPAGEADAPGCLLRGILLRTHRGMKPNPVSRARPHWNPREPAFAKLALPENPACAGPFGDQSRFSPASAKSRAMSRAQGAFHRGETRARWGRRAANRAPPCARLWDRGPQ
jgi:hypothetical protein